MLYLLDANVLITANNLYYPIDSVPETACRNIGSGWPIWAPRAA